MSGSKTMKAKPMILLTDGMHRKNKPGCLLKVVAYVYLRMDSVFQKYSAQHPSVLISQFLQSTDSAHIETITAHLPFLNLIGRSQFRVIQLARYKWIVYFCGTPWLYIFRSQITIYFVASSMWLIPVLFR